MTAGTEILRENIVVELTPVGRGAVAVVLAAGPDAANLVDASFRPASGRSIAMSPTSLILFGRWREPDGEELVVCRRSVDRVEIHCHGGVAAVADVTSTLKQQGCRQLPWRDWLRHDTADPIRAAAQIVLADAPTARTASILLDQYDGALAAAIRMAQDATASEDWSQAAAAIENVLAHRNVGAHLINPWRVVLAGPPNVGKSSLINALAGYERAIVSPTPGTTRDVVATRTAIDGWPMELADTAGLRASDDPLELAGVSLAAAAAAGADLVLLVQDAAHVNSAADARRQPNLASQKCIHVWNKIDLVTGPPLIVAAYGGGESGTRSVFTSAVTSFGIATLIDAIGSALVPKPPASGAAVPFTAAQRDALETANTAIGRRDAAAAYQAMHRLLAS